MIIITRVTSEDILVPKMYPGKISEELNFHGIHSNDNFDQF